MSDKTKTIERNVVIKDMTKGDVHFLSTSPFLHHYDHHHALTNSQEGKMTYQYGTILKEAVQKTASFLFCLQKGLNVEKFFKILDKL